MAHLLQPAGVQVIELSHEDPRRGTVSVWNPQRKELDVPDPDDPGHASETGAN